MTDYQHSSDPPAARSDAEQRKRFEAAKHRVAVLKGFYIHFFIFVAVILGLLVVNWGIGGPWWVQWVFIGWGVGVLAHAFGVFGRGFTVAENWERRKIKEFMDKP
jgi:hypothetical protein